MAGTLIRIRLPIPWPASAADGCGPAWHGDQVWPDDLDPTNDLGHKARVSYGSQHTPGIEAHATIYAWVPKVSQEHLLHRHAGVVTDRRRAFAQTSPGQGGVDRHDGPHKSIRLVGHPGRQDGDLLPPGRRRWWQWVPLAALGRWHILGPARTLPPDGGLRIARLPCGQH